MREEIKYDHLAYFVYYVFIDLFLIVACDKENKVIGYISIRPNGDLGRIYVNPVHRGGDLIHLLIREALHCAKKLGMPGLWGVCYDRMAKFYRRYYTKLGKRFGYTWYFVQSPEERDDGQWLIRGELVDEDDSGSA